MAIGFSVEEGVAVVTLNRPEARNAIDGATALELAEAVRRINADEAIRCAVITGAGGHFCAGMDLKAFLRGEAVRVPGQGFAGIAQAELAKPFVAAVEGYALAGGFEIVLACDLVVAASTARFGLSEVKRGLVPNAGGLVRLPRQIPVKLASELVLTGEIVEAGRLAQAGLVNRLVPEGGALAEAMRFAGLIAANGPLAVAISRRVLRESLEWPEAELFDRQNAITAPVFTSEDAREGAAAFVEKRKPVWKGR